MKVVVWRLMLLAVVCAWGCQFLVAGVKQYAKQKSGKVISGVVVSEVIEGARKGDVPGNGGESKGIYLRMSLGSGAVYLSLGVWIGTVLPGIGAGVIGAIRSRKSRDLDANERTPG